MFVYRLTNHFLLFFNFSKTSDIMLFIFLPRNIFKIRVLNSAVSQSSSWKQDNPLWLKTSKYFSLKPFVNLWLFGP